MDEQAYLQERVDDQINWYGGKSQTNQAWFKRLRVVEIISAAIIPLLAGLSLAQHGTELAIGILGVVIAICAGLTGLNQYQENWLNYRATCEALKQEKIRYLTRCNPYGGSDAFELFVERIESLLSSENKQWSRSHSQRSSPGEADSGR